MKLATMEESNARKRRIKSSELPPTTRQKVTKEEDNARKRRWRKENTDTIYLTCNKKLHIRELLTQRSDHAQTAQQYIISAILEKLERDGIDIHMFDD